MKKNVKIINKKDQTVLLEWTEGKSRQRGFLPIELAAESEIGGELKLEASLLKEAVPYGFPWEKVINITFDPQKLVNILHDNDIWTLDDFNAHPQVVVTAIRTVIGLELSEIRHNINSLMEEFK